MVLASFTSTVTASALRSNFDDKTATLATNAIAGQKDQTRYIRHAAPASGTALSARTVAWTQVDDAEVRVFAVRNTDTGAGKILTGTLTEDTGDAELLVDNTVSVAVTSINGTVDSRDSSATDYRTTTGVRFRLKRGVRYRLTLSSDTAGASGVTLVLLQLRSLRRAA